MASLAQQLAGVAATQHATVQQQSEAIGALERDKARLVEELNDAQATVAAQAEEVARLGRCVFALAIVIAGLGALVLILGMLAAPGWTR